MTETQAIQLFKCLADKSRMQILKSLMIEDMYVERLAQRLNLTPATISFHLKKLEDVGAVSSTKDQYYMMYSLRKEVFQTNIWNLKKTERETLFNYAFSIRLENEFENYYEEIRDFIHTKHIIDRGNLYKDLEIIKKCDIVGMTVN